MKYKAIRRHLVDTFLLNLSEFVMVSLTPEATADAFPTQGSLLTLRPREQRALRGKIQLASI